ncbi:MAG: triphosphoribosyl-dephospho-CoA synthase CitG [Lachnospiraceae bacterium]
MIPITDHLRQLCAQALLSEVETTPKPGLVDLHDNGAHKDMCYQTFRDSTEAIVPYLGQMAETGLSWQGDEEGLFLAIRPVGIQAEQAMFQATGGVNTHKGLVFSLGIIMAAAGLYYQKHQCFQSEEILLLCQTMTQRQLEQDFSFAGRREPKTHGEKLYVRYGCKGIRGEAQSGFASIRNISLPWMRHLASRNLEKNTVYLLTLLKLMAQVDDTNVLIRTSPEMLTYVKQEAKRLLDLDIQDEIRLTQEVSLMNLDFIEKNISPGGCADLLAVTIFLWLLEQQKGEHAHETSLL